MVVLHESQDNILKFQTLVVKIMVFECYLVIKYLSFNYRKRIFALEI